MSIDLNNYAEISKAALDSAKALGEINYSIASRMVQQQMDLLNICLEGTVKQMRALSEADDVKVLLDKQANLTDEVGKKVISNLQGSLEVLEGAKGQWTDWSEANVAKLQKAA